MRHFRYFAPAMLACALVFSASMAHGQQVDAAVTLFNNVRVFDGKSAALSAPSNVLVRGNMIETHLGAADPGRSPAPTRASSTAAGAR